MSLNSATHIFILLSKMITSQLRSELNILSPHLSLSMVLHVQTDFLGHCPQIEHH